MYISSNFATRVGMEKYWYQPVKLLLKFLKIFQFDQVCVGHGQQLGRHGAVPPIQGFVGQPQKVVHPRRRDFAGLEAASLQKSEADAAIEHHLGPML